MFEDNYQPIHGEHTSWKEKFELLRNKTSYELAQYLVEKYYVKTLGDRRDREIYIYSEGVYVPGTHKLRAEIQAKLQEFADTRVKNEILEKIRDLTVIDRKAFNVDRKYINLQNGILDITNGELLEHSPEYLFLNIIPVHFDKTNECPRIHKFLEEVLDESDVPVVQEWFGYSLYRTYFIKKALILVGERDTGKSTLLKLFDRMIGKENISGVSLQSLARDKFAAAHLFNKHINIYDDLSFSDINDNGAFKIATGGGVITGEYKFGDQFHFESHSKLTFSCNKIPNVQDSNDEAYFSRWIVIQFNKSVAVPDKFLMDKLSTAEEISGLLNFALEGLGRLIKNEEFSYKKEPDEIKSEMLRSGSSIANFAYDCLDEVMGGWISKEDLYNAYIIYASVNKIPAGTMSELGRKLTKYAVYVSDGKKQIEDVNTGKKKQITGWRNVGLKDPLNEMTGEEIRDIIDF